MVSALLRSGSYYCLFWADGRDGNDEIYFIGISPSRTKITSDIRLTNAADFSLGPEPIFTGSELGIAWHDNRDGSQEVYFYKVGCQPLESTWLTYPAIPIHNIIDSAISEK
jgi:hypothetical protein